MTAASVRTRAVVPAAHQIEGHAVHVREPSLRGTVAAGLAMIGLFFGGFLGWTMFADLDSAVVSQGTVVVDSHRKTVQHLEGGILKELLVKEGDRVQAGQTIAYLDTTQADAALGQLVSQSWSVKARLARLRADLPHTRQRPATHEGVVHAHPNEGQIHGSEVTAEQAPLDGWDRVAGATVVE